MTRQEAVDLATSALRVTPETKDMSYGETLVSILIALEVLKVENEHGERG